MVEILDGMEVVGVPVAECVETCPVTILVRGMPKSDSPMVVKEEDIISEIIVETGGDVTHHIT